MRFPLQYDLRDPSLFLSENKDFTNRERVNKTQTNFFFLNLPSNCEQAALTKQESEKTTLSP